jgi:uncharacterized membrane protein HdeD (DUF308 family)
MNTSPTEQTYSGSMFAVEILKPKWGWILASGLLTLVFGVLAFMMPIAAVYTMTILFGAYAMVDGIFSVVSAVKAGGTSSGNFWPLLLRGVLGLFTGILVFVLPLVSTLTLVTFAWAMISIWSIATGLLELTAAIRLRREIKGEWLLGLSGLISLGLGIAILVLLWSDPTAGIVPMGWMIGFYAVLHGLVEIALAFALRKFQH